MKTTLCKENCPKIISKMIWIHHLKWRYLWMALLFSGSLLYLIVVCLPILYVPHNLRLPGFVYEENAKNILSKKSGYLVYTRGCHIPDLDPFDRHVKRFYHKESPINCSQNKPPNLVGSNLTALFIIQSALGFYNVSDVEKIQCCYQTFWRVNENKIKYSNDCQTFVKEVHISEEFVKVKCSYEGLNIFTYYYAFTPLKKKVEERCQKKNIIPKEAVSLLVLGIDSVSRLNLYRQMPRTVALLKEIKATEMLGYNKIGDNTFPNAVAFLTGLKEKELKIKCWPNRSNYLDSCPWIWKNFSDDGYRTAFVEDCPWMGMFNYLKRGFRKQPTDYYLRPFQKLLEDKKGHKGSKSTLICIGPQIILQVLLNYISKFLITMSLNKYFALFWSSSVTHDYMNHAQQADKLCEDFIRNESNSYHFNKTVLVFLSDHGVRWGGIRQTFQGHLEERLPFLFFYFPKWFREKYSSALNNMRRNSRLLTTPFDLHETFKDLSNLRLIENDLIKKRSNELKTLATFPRGTSLFLPLDEGRTCSKAGIDPHWCTCLESHALATKSLKAQISAKVVIVHLNKLLKPYHACSSLRLSKILDASIKMPLLSQHKSHTIEDCVVVVTTKPGNGIFQATVRHGLGDGSPEVHGIVSRINRYNNQSACVLDYHMKLYCYCKP